VEEELRESKPTVMTTGINEKRSTATNFTQAFRNMGEEKTDPLMYESTRPASHLNFKAKVPISQSSTSNAGGGATSKANMQEGKTSG